MARTGNFSYSEKNEYDFVLPANYREMLLNSMRPSESRKIRRTARRKNATGMVWIRILRVLAFIVLTVAVVMLARRLYEYGRDVKYADAKNRSIAMSAEAKEAANLRETPKYPVFAGSEEIEKSRFSYPPVCDKENLQQFSLVYPDFVMWLYLDGTTINYPVVQAKDNEYYLRRNMDGENNTSGTIFLDYRNDPRNLRGNNIVYGHAMQNGTMFGSLQKFKSREYWEAHRMVYTYTADEVTAWEIFSAYDTTTDNYYIQTYFSSDEDYLSFLNKLKSDSLYPTEAELTAKSDILTFSTCHLYNYSNGRFVIHAVKVGTTPMN